MLFFTLAIHQNLIKKFHHILADEALKNMIQKLHESVWCVNQTKKHYEPLIKASFGFKSHFPLISLIDQNLVVATSKINLRKDSGLYNSSRKSSNRGMGLWYLIVILLIAWLSRHILILPSYFATSKAGLAQRLRPSWVMTLARKSSTCHWTSWVSWGFIQ